MRRVLLICTAMTAALAPEAAQASGPYVAVEGGAYLQKKLDYDFIGLNNFFDSGYKRGYDVAGSLGYDFEGIRVELEVGYKHARADRFGFQFGGTPVATQRGSAVSGNSHVFTSMLNAYYDIGQWRVRPYVGGGIGVANVTADHVGYAGFGDSGVFLNASDVAFAWQLMGGVRARLTRHVTAGIGYRYMDVPHVRLAQYNTIVKTELRSSSILGTLTYNFRPPYADSPLVLVPTPAAIVESNTTAPPPPPPVQTGFVVTFATGGTKLSPDTSRQLDGAADAYAKVGHASVMVTSDAETTGPALYDERLASRRADRARDYLVAHGTPRDAVTIQTFDSAHAAAGLANVNPRGSIDLTFGPGSGR